MIEIKNDELLGEYINIKKNGLDNRDSILIRVVSEDGYVLGELVITDKMRVFYNHKKRVVKDILED